MSNEKKNPLIGAFRTPVAGAPPTPAPPIPAKGTKPPILSPAAVKPGEVKKPAEPAKDDKVAKDRSHATPRHLARGAGHIYADRAENAFKF